MTASAIPREHSSTANMSAPFVLPIVARSSEVELIAQVRDNASRGHGGVILLSGDGGVGKTRLVSESAIPARSAGWRVAIGRAYAVETAIPYAPFADALQPVLEELDPHVLTRITRGDRSALIAVAPSLAGNSPTENPGSGLSGAEQRSRTCTGPMLPPSSSFTFSHVRRARCGSSSSGHGMKPNGTCHRHLASWFVHSVRSAPATSFSCNRYRNDR